LKEGETASESASSSGSSKSSKSSSSAAADGTDAANAEPKKKLVRSAVTYDVKMLGYEKHPRKEMKRMQDR
jgi:hypoxia up-regulated 1